MLKQSVSSLNPLSHVAQGLFWGDEDRKGLSSDIHRNSFLSLSFPLASVHIVLL